MRLPATPETEQRMTVMNTPTLFERLEGSASIDVAVDQFYERLLDDTELVPFFEGVPMGRQRAHQKALLTMALGGPVAYEGRGLHEAHAALTIDDQHFDRVAGHLAGVLLGLGVASELVDEVIAAVDGLRSTVLGRG
jgi:hemoglobin